MCPIWHAKLFPECFQEKSYPDCGEFGINQAGMDKQLCILQFIILNITDLRHDHSSLTGLLFSLESSREKMFTRQMSIINENLLNKKTNFKHISELTCYEGQMSFTQMSHTCEEGDSIALRNEQQMRGCVWSLLL